jgi:hypothetical protein
MQFGEVTWTRIMMALYIMVFGGIATALYIGFILKNIFLMPE